MSSVKTSYLSYDDAVALHVELMRSLGARYYGIANKEALQAALERPAMAARYVDADLFTQAATLLWGLLRNPSFGQGNNGTGVALTFAFLWRNGWEVFAEQEEVVGLGSAIAEGQRSVEEAARWLREHSRAVA